MAINIGNRNAKLKPGIADRGFIEDKTSYIYGENTATVTDFSYTGGVQTFLAKPGIHKLRVWGAAGGGNPSYPGGKGGYSEGKMKVSRDTNLYVYVGGQGPYVSNGSNINGGWNGGGTAASDGSGVQMHRVTCGGGGGTDISLVGGDCTLSNRVYIRQALSYLGRLIVAGGGGGSNYGNATYVGGEGGGTSGVSCNGTGSSNDGGKGGTQNAGGAKSNWCNNRGTDGSFGYGGYATASGTGGVYEGGGGGWYGGGAGVAGGGGGSGYVATENSYKPSGYSVPENLYLKDAETKDGKSQFLSPDGTLETGHAGDGHAIIESEIRPVVPDVTYVTQPGVYHNPTLGLISISADGQNWITISDKNVGATVADPEDINSNGDIFQYGNIHHFAGDGSGGTVATEAQIPDLTGYEGGNLYSDDKYRTNIDWNAANKNLWKWIAFNLKSLGKGPCPLGFHVPSAEEWTAVMDTILELAGESFSYNLISKYLLMVHPNSRKGDGAFYANNTSIYLTNSYIANQNKINAFVMIGDEGSESGGLSATDMNCGGYIRPFRDEVMIPTTEWTKLPSGSSQYWIDGYYEMVEDKWYADAEMTQEIEPEEFKYYRYIRYNTPVFYQYINGHFVVQKKNETTLTRNEAITLSEGNTRKELMVWNGRGLGVITSRGSAYAHLLKRNDVDDITVGNAISIGSDLQYLYSGFHLKTGAILAGNNGSGDNTRNFKWLYLNRENNTLSGTDAFGGSSGAPFQGNMVDDESEYAYGFDNGSNGGFRKMALDRTGIAGCSDLTGTTFSNICGGAWHDGRIVVQPDGNANTYFGTPVEGTNTINWTSYAHGLGHANSVGSDRVRNVYVGASNAATLARGRGTRESMSWTTVNVALNTGGQIYVDEIGDVWYEGETATGLGWVRFGEFMTAEDIIAKQTPLYDIVYENGNFKDLQGHELVKTGNISVGDHYWRVSSDINKMLFRHRSGDTYPAAHPFTVMRFGKTNGNHFSSDHPTMVAFSDSANKLVFSVGFTQDNSSLQVNHLRENSAWDTATYATSNFDSSVRHHYAMTWGGEGTGSGKLMVYIDGIATQSITASGGGTGTPAPTGGLSVFGRYVDGVETESGRSNCFNGDLYDVKCFGYKMDTDDIKSYLKNYGYYHQTSIDTKLYMPMIRFDYSAIWGRRTRAKSTGNVSRSTTGGVVSALFSNGYISLTNPFFTRNKNTTFCGWLYCTGVNTGNGKIFDIRNNFGVTNGQVVYTYNSGSPTGYGFYGYRSDSTEPSFFEGVARLNQWLCYCVTFDENNIPTMYLKGAGVNTKITGPQQANLEGVPPYMNIGNEYNNPSSSSNARRFFNGGMSRLIYEHRNRTEAEYNEYYDKTKWIFGIS